MPVKKNVVPIERLLYAVGEVETGHIKSMAARYRVVNSIGAHGRYQVMRDNIPSWTRQALGKTLTPRQFLDSPEAQDKVAAYYLGRHQKKYGDWRAAVSIWFSGQPDWTKKRSDGHFTIPQYIEAAQKHIDSGKRVDGQTDAASPDFEQTGVTDTLLAPVKGLAAGVASIAKSLMNVGEFATFLMKLALPSTWVRIMCGFLGIGFLIFGLLVLGREAKGT